LAGAPPPSPPPSPPPPPPVLGDAESGARRFVDGGVSWPDDMATRAVGEEKRMGIKNGKEKIGKRLVVQESLFGFFFSCTRRMERGREGLAQRERLNSHTTKTQATMREIVRTIVHTTYIQKNALIYMLH
jgi:hypothetical protein